MEAQHEIKMTQLKNYVLLSCFFLLSKKKTKKTEGMHFVMPLVYDNSTKLALQLE